MKKNNSFKEKLNVLRELWKVPRYKALIKLSIYAIMFIFIILCANIYSPSPSNEKENIEKTDSSTLTDIIKNTKLDNLNLKYTIESNGLYYTIEGEIKDNNLGGYIENNDVIKKIILKSDVLYTVISNEEIYDEELNNNLIGHLLLPQNIIDIVQDKKSYIVKNESTSSYSYNIIYNNDNYEITLNTNLKYITSMVVKNDTLEYNLTFDFDNQ